MLKQIAMAITVSHGGSPVVTTTFLLTWRLALAPSSLSATKRDGDSRGFSSTYWHRTCGQKTADRDRTGCLRMLVEPHATLPV